MAIGSVLDEALQLWRELVETFVLVKMRRDRHLKLEGLLERSRGVRPRRISAEVVVCAKEESRAACSRTLSLCFEIGDNLGRLSIKRI